jgi:pimeloyl-ACP methyl ester carboxylesterase
VLAHREALPEGAPLGDVLCVHGYPETSYMWRHLLSSCAAAGWRAFAPDLPGFGDSPLAPPHTWKRAVEALEAFRTERGLSRVVLVVHDWGGLIGLRWACDNPDAVRALVISDTGFFADGRWHGLAEALRTEGQGEEVMANMSREGLSGLLRQASRDMDDAAIDEYWKSFATPEHRQGHLELYRSGDFSELAPYEGRLGALGVPALVLWGEDDMFAPLAGAKRFERQIPGARLEVVPGTGHFVYADAPAETAAAITRFLGELG